MDKKEYYLEAQFWLKQQNEASEIAESDRSCERCMEPDFGGVKEKWSGIKQEAKRRSCCII